MIISNSDFSGSQVHSTRSRLPPELWLCILELIPRHDALALRAADKTLHAIATPVIFGVLHFTNTARSVVALHSLLASSVREHLREIQYLDSHVHETRVDSRAIEVQGPSYGYRLQLSNQDRGLATARYNQGEVNEHLLGAISLLGASPSFHSADITFDPRVDLGSTIVRNVNFQHKFLSTLASLSPAPAFRSLSFRNVSPYANKLFLSPAFLEILRGLKSLAFTIQHASWEPIQGFFATSLPAVLRAPADTLTSLTLHSSRDIGGHQDLTLHDITYPHLTYLSLQYIILDEQTGVEQFILAHAATLTSLTLKYCRLPVLDGMRKPARSWHTVYGGLSAGLGELRDLVVEEGEDTEWEDYTVRYVKWRRRLGHRNLAWHACAAGGEEDSLALKAFHEVVRRRKAASESS